MSGSFPTSPKAASVRVTSISQTLVSSSHSFKEQRRLRGGHRWTLDLKFPPMTREEFAPLYAFAVSQRGQYETFTYTPPVLKDSLANPTGSPLVNGSHTAGDSTIATDGWTASITTVKAGDFIKFSGHTKVYMVTADMTSDGSGTGTISITPPLKSDLADNETVYVDEVSFNVRLDSDSLAFDTSPQSLYRVDLSLIEVF